MLKLIHKDILARFGLHTLWNIVSSMLLLCLLWRGLTGWETLFPILVLWALFSGVVSVGLHALVSVWEAHAARMDLMAEIAEMQEVAQEDFLTLRHRLAERLKKH